MANSSLADVSVARPWRYRPQHAAPSLPVRFVRASQSRIQALVYGAPDTERGRRSPRSPRGGPVSLGWEQELAPARRLISASAPVFGAGSASAASTLPLPRIA